MDRSPKPVALVDLDGSVADYDKAMRRDFERLCAPGEDVSVVHDESKPWVKARRDLISRQPGWWRRLERLERGFEVVDMLRALEYSLTVCTRASKEKPDCWSEKVSWASEHLPDASLTITLNKGLIYGRVLVDDWPSYGTAWLKHRPRGLLVMVAQPWNTPDAEGMEKLASDPRVIRYDGTNQDVLFSRLFEARHPKAGPVYKEEILT